jgi:hypothetical protein
VSDRGPVAAGRERRSRTAVPDVLAKGVAEIAAPSDDPHWRIRQASGRSHRSSLFMGLAGERVKAAARPALPVISQAWVS